MKLHIATPMYGGNCTAGYTSSILNLSKIVKFEHNFVTNESLVTRARNMLVHTFLASDCTHLLFIDADVAFDANGVAKMLESDKDVVGGLYAKKYINWEKVQTAALRGVRPENLAAHACDYYIRGVAILGSTECVEVESVATGLLLINRSVFDTLQDDVPVSKLGSRVIGQIHEESPVRHYFDTAVDSKTGEFLSEDYAFCQRWRAKGGKVYAAPWVRTMHIGTHNFG